MVEKHPIGVHASQPVYSGIRIPQSHMARISIVGTRGKIFLMWGVFVHDKDLGLAMAQNDQKPCFFEETPT